MWRERDGQEEKNLEREREQVALSDPGKKKEGGCSSTTMTSKLGAQMSSFLSFQITAVNLPFFSRPSFLLVLLVLVLLLLACRQVPSTIDCGLEDQRMSPPPLPSLSFPPPPPHTHRER